MKSVRGLETRLREELILVSIKPYLVTDRLVSYTKIREGLIKGYAVYPKSIY
jgi:hypothetical protein